MSLIQDALKRQQEEMNKKGTAETPSSSLPPVKPLGKLDTPTVPPPPSIESKTSLHKMGQSLGAPKHPLNTPGPAQEPPAPSPEPAPVSPPAAPTSGSMPRIALNRDIPKAGSEPVTSVEPKTGAVVSKSEIEPENRSKQIVVLVGLLLLLAIGVGIYFGWSLLASQFSPPSPVPALESSTRPTPEPNAPTSPPPSVEAATISNGVLVAASPFMPASTNLSPEAASNSVPEQTLEIIPLPALPASAPLIRPAITSAPAPVANADFQFGTKLPSAPVFWPPVKLTGLVKLGKTSAALINGKVVAAGESIENVVLVNVTSDGALVRFEGEERVLRVGETAR